MQFAFTLGAVKLFFRRLLCGQTIRQKLSTPISGTYVDAKTGKRVSVGSRPIHNLLKRSLFFIPLLALPSLSNADDARAPKTRAEQLGNWEVSINDVYEGRTVQVTPIRELRVASGHRRVGSTFANGFFDSNFWSTATVNSGYLNVANGSIFIYGSTSTQIDGTAYLQSNRVARFVSGSANEFRAVVRVSTDIPATGTNDMRWGLASQPFATPATIDDGLYFRYSNGAFYVGYRVGGVDNPISTNSFNGTVPTITSDYAEYQIVYTNLVARFFVNEILVHKFTATDTTLGHTVNFRARAQNYNSGGCASNNVLEAKVLSVLSLGSASTDAVFKNLATGAASSVLKYGPGYLHNITVNAPGTAGTSIAVYDSTYTAAGQTIATLDTSKTSITGIKYDLPFSNGLYVVPTGTFGDVTVVYE